MLIRRSQILISCDTEIFYFFPASRQKAKQAQTQGNVFHELGNKVNERGERLNELDQKFKEVNQASGDFLKAIKDYNERQAQKKWWEF
jgi:flagellar biosynthesis/type III secretory pathway chaperone